MLFLIDENIPDGVALELSRRGHQIRLVREHLVAGTPDQTVAAAAADLEALIVTNDKDFNQIISRRPPDNFIRWRRLGRVTLSCRPAQMARRIAVALSVIELETREASERADPRVIVEIGGDVIRLER